MAHIFISHAHEDYDRAAALAKLIQRITLQQVKCWYSSDRTIGGGIGAGERWFDAVKDQIAEAKVVIPLVTEKSQNSNWVHFETGFGSSFENIKIVPACAGVTPKSLTPPLSIYNCYDVHDARDLTTLLQRVCEIFSISFDAEFARSAIDSADKSLTRTDEAQARIEKPVGGEDLIGEVKAHVNSVFHQLVRNSTLKPDGLEYDVLFVADESLGGAEYLLRISARDTVQDILNEREVCR